MNFTAKNKHQDGADSKAPAAKIFQLSKSKKRFFIFLIILLPLIIFTLFVTGFILPEYHIIHNVLLRLQPHKLFAGFDEKKECVRAGNENTIRISGSFITDREEDRVESHLDKGDEFYKRNQIDQAIEEYKRYLDFYSMDETRRANINFIIGNVYFERLHDYENAMARSV